MLVEAIIGNSIDSSTYIYFLSKLFRKTNTIITDVPVTIIVLFKQLLQEGLLLMLDCVETIPTLRRHIISKH